MKDKSTLTAYAVAALGVVALLWIVPPVGVIAALIALALVPPWGRGLVERALISAIVTMGIVAVVFPRDSSIPVTPESARALLSALVIGSVALRLIPRLRCVPLPRVGASDLLIVTFGVVGWIWLSSAYWGANAEQILSGLFMSGWDNQGHFLPFANTYEAQMTAWTTVDGTIAWNQWYPSLHSTLWALAEQATNGSGASRLELLWPYVSWTVLSFAASFAALAYVAGDLAARLTPHRKTWARMLATGAVGVFGLLGSPALLFNSGFTNFVMGVALVVTASYMSARSMRSARSLGWFLIPAAGLAVLGLWTPLVLGLVPVGLVVLVALWRAPDLSVPRRRVLAIVWAVGTGAAVALVALDQSQAILGVDGNTAAAEFNQDIGRVGTGMIEFNTGLALAAPVIVVFAALVVRRRGVPMMIAIATPTLVVGVLAYVFSLGADSNGVARLQNYYVLKSLDGMLMMIAPTLAALAAAAMTRALNSSGALTRLSATAVAALVGLSAFGYVGIHPEKPWETFTAAPGIKAGIVRASAVQSPLVGEGILAGVAGAQQAPSRTPLLWDGAGHLPNLWLRSLTGALSKQEAQFYGGMPPFPYDQKSLDYLSLSLNLKPGLELVIVYFRPPSGDQLAAARTELPDNRVEVVRAEMRQSALCGECSP